jgi:hypothetical protein
VKTKGWIAAGAGLALLVVLGLGTRTKVCTFCEGQGGIDLTWYGMRLLTYPRGDFLFDEYGSTELWEQIHGRPCSHEWRAWITVSLAGRREHGTFLVWGDRGAALRGLANENKDWARLAWDSVRRLPSEAQSVPRSRLEELGGVVGEPEHRVKPGSREVVVSWWNRNQNWIAGAKPK